MQPEASTEALEQASATDKLLLPKGIRDGYEVHRAALGRGLNVRLLPRQVMQVNIPEEPESTTGFAHGVPQATSLAGATYAQDQRMRRAMLQKAGYAVPRGATFSVGRSRTLGRKFAERIGFPVVVKPAVGDNTIEVQTGIRNERQLKQSIEYLFTPPSQRKSFTRAAYALTELREPGKINGRLVAPPGYRFLIEKQEQGDYLRFLIIGGEVRNVMLCPAGPWTTRASKMNDVTKDIHPNLEVIAKNAARVVPGLAVTALDMVVPNYKETTAIHDAKIVEFSERPWLSVQRKCNPNLASRLADEILTENLPGAAHRSIRSRISAEVLIGGAVNPNRLLGILKDKFEELDIRGDLQESDHTLGLISGTAEGTPADIAWVMERLMDKGIRNQRAMLVHLKNQIVG